MATITDVDRQAVQDYLRDYGYASLEEWALDSDYRQHEVSCEWYDTANWTPFGGAVDLEQACFSAIEAAGEAQDEQRYGFF